MDLKSFSKLATGAVVLFGAASAVAQPPAVAPATPCPPAGLSAAFSRACPQKQFANPSDIAGLMAALPDKPYATPKAIRRVLVLCRAAGFVHSSIPLAAKMVEYLGDRTGAWMTTITYDAGDITAENLRKYDALFLNSTTGQFLDDPNDTAVSEARKRALLDFIKGGKGIAGIHAASDSYHTNRPTSPLGPPTQRGTWPEFNEIIGGFFKYHWNHPTLIIAKIDDPKSPLTVMYDPKRGYEIVDETYTYAQDSFSRKRVHVLTSVNYQRMSAEDKAKEPAATRRTDGDYALSYIQRVGAGRMFYESHGHDEKVYFQRPFVAHMLAGIQYVLGDLEADDSPSQQ